MRDCESGLCKADGTCDTDRPTASPSASPTASPSAVPSASPTPPTASPSSSPTQPTRTPTPAPPTTTVDELGTDDGGADDGVGGGGRAGAIIGGVNGFVIAKGVIPPELCKVCCDDLLSRGPEARRTSDILKYNDAFSEVLVHTWNRLGPLMEAIMGPRCFLNGYISNNLPPGDEHVGSPGEPDDTDLDERWKRGMHSDYPCE